MPSLYPFLDVTTPSLSWAHPGKRWSPQGDVDSPCRGTARAIPPANRATVGPPALPA